MKYVIYNNIEHLYYSKVFSWCNLKLADRFIEDQMEMILPENSIWMSEEDAKQFESIPWID